MKVLKDEQVEPFSETGRHEAAYIYGVILSYISYYHVCNLYTSTM